MRPLARNIAQALSGNQPASHPNCLRHTPLARLIPHISITGVKPRQGSYSIMENRRFSTLLQTVLPFAACALLLPCLPCRPAHAQGAESAAVQPAAPVKRTSIMLPASGLPGSSQLRERLAPQFAVRPDLTPVNTGSGIVYTCDPSVSTAICDYLNTTVAGYYNSTFTNANANIYITFGTTGLGESDQYYNFITYDQYVAALTGNAHKSPIQTSALSALATYDATPYGSGHVEVTSALAAALGYPGLTGNTSSMGACTAGSNGCYNGLITVTNDPGITLYYDNLGGSEPSGAYDFYAVVEHETDEVLGTSSCIYSTGSGLTDGCNFEAANTPSAVDLYRYSAAGDLVLDSSLSTTAGAYFSYDGGGTDGAKGLAAEPKYYNTLDNGADYADFAYIADCGPNIAIQDAYGCPGEDGGLTILNDGGGEINLLTAVGYQVPVVTEAAALTSPTPGSQFAASSVTFTWSAGEGVTNYWLNLGTAASGVNAKNLYSSGPVTVLTETVTSLPTNGETIYATLYSKIAGVFQPTVYTFYATGPAVLTAPSPATKLTASTTFTWSPGTGISHYWFNLGTSATSSGAKNIYAGSSTTALTATVTGIPQFGETLYATLYSYISGAWQPIVYPFTASGAPVPAVLSLSPALSFSSGVAVNGSLYVVGGSNVGGILGSLEILSASGADTWSAGAAMPTPVNLAMASAPGDGMLYVAGGHGQTVTRENTMQQYNPGSNTWATMAPMPTARYQGAAASVGGQVYVAGGWGPSVPYNVLEAYNPVSKFWTSLAPMPHLSACGVAGAINSLLYVFTPCNGFSGYTALLDVYDPVANSWTSLASGPNSHAGGAGGVINGRLYIAGGLNFSGVASSTLDVYDPATGWSTLAPMPVALQGMGADVIDGILYLAGGYDGTNYYSTVYAYNTVSNAWSVQPSIPALTNKLAGASATFTWTAGEGVNYYWLNLGTASSGANAKNLYSSGSTTLTSATATGLPTNGETIYATLYSYIAGVWQPTVYTYTASGSPTPAVLTTPSPTTQLTSSTVTFTWSPGNPATHYWLNIGTGTSGAAAKNLYAGGSTTATSVTVSGLPTNGETIYATLYSYIGGAWQPTVYTYTAQ